MSNWGRGGGREEVSMIVREQRGKKKKQRGESWADGNVLYLDHVSVNNLLVILHLSFERCYHWEKLIEGIGDFSVVVLVIACESKLASKEKV